MCRSTAITTAFMSARAVSPRGPPAVLCTRHDRASMSSDPSSLPRATSQRHVPETLPRPPSTMPCLRQPVLAFRQHGGGARGMGQQTEPYYIAYAVPFPVRAFRVGGVPKKGPKTLKWLPVRLFRVRAAQYLGCLPCARHWSAYRLVSRVLAPYR